MKILALELSTARGSLAWRDDDVDLVREWPNDRKNSGPLFENVKLVSEKFGSPEKIIVGLGPGSYAGVRIAISAAIGLSFGGTGGACPEPVERVPFDEKIELMGRHGGRPSIRLIGFPSICAIEADIAEYCVIGDARRQTFFFARIRDNNLIEGPILFAETELRDKLSKQNMSIFASEKLPQFERVMLCYPSAVVLARLALDPTRNFAQPPLEPMYLREPHITNPKK